MKRPEHLHEDLARDHVVAVGSERSFGWVFAALFLLAGALTASPWWLTGGLAFAAIAWGMPSILRPLNLLWFRFGLLLHALVSPVILALMFFLVFTPIGWCMRLFGRRPLSLAADPGLKSYWVHRAPPGPAPDSFDRQF